MKVETIEQAFTEIENAHAKMPVEAIEFLYSCDKNEKITEKLKFSLSNAYSKKVYYNEEDDYYHPTPLWYAIVAENHLSEELIEPIIKLFTSTEADWDYLNEQGNFLTGKLCSEIGEKAVSPILEVILKDSKQKKKHPTLFLFDCLHYIDKEKHLPIIFEILENGEYIWIDSLAVHLGDAQVSETLDRLKEIRDAFSDTSILGSFSRGDLEEGITELETGKSLYPSMAGPYFKKRKDWKEHYNDYNQPSPPLSSSNVSSVSQLENINSVSQIGNLSSINKVMEKKVKVGRNDPCPCGSGKKYKKCCLKK